LNGYIQISGFGLNKVLTLFCQYFEFLESISVAARCRGRATVIHMLFVFIGVNDCSAIWLDPKVAKDQVSPLGFCRTGPLPAKRAEPGLESFTPCFAAPACASVKNSYALQPHWPALFCPFSAEAWDGRVGGRELFQGYFLDVLLGLIISGILFQG
jgi:hypothetical protein